MTATARQTTATEGREELAMTIHGVRYARHPGNENGDYWYSAESGLSVWEDTQDYPGPPRFYAWRGTMDDHDSALHGRVCASASCAVDALVEARAGRVRLDAEQAEESR